MDQPNSSANQTADASTETVAARVSHSSTSHRRRLLRGLLGGSAAAGAGVPLKAHARYAGNFCDKQAGGGKGRPAAASTHGSVVSLTPDNTNECSGYKPSCYGSGGNCYNSTGKSWTFACPTLGYTSKKTITCNSKFYDVFNSPNVTANQGSSLLALCGSGTASLERTYATAYANACRAAAAGSTFKFPYSPSQVVALYQNPSQQVNGRALFDGYLSNRT